MKATEFAYWLQGVFELGNIKSFDEKQTQMIRNHLNMVFFHDIDPKAGDDKHQKELSSIHANTSQGLHGLTLRC